MKQTALLTDYNPERMKQLLQHYPVFDWILHNQPEQFAEILKICRLFRAHSHELIIKKGEFSSWVYLVLEGSCFVYMDDDDLTPINQVLKGELLGEVAAVTGRPRLASVVASFDVPETLLIGIDFSTLRALSQSAIDLKARVVLHYAVYQTIYSRLLSVYADYKKMVKKPVVIPPKGYPPFYSSPNAQLHDLTRLSKQAGQFLVDLSSELSEFLNHHSLPSVA